MSRDLALWITLLAGAVTVILVVKALPLVR